ncbi:metallophosphoesterase family protein [Peptoniphilus catoniae]|uniref:metallophosphoesterase family protein n=1 Tax=Peptoniphilus catoniae TaxID=1660341 RepID=UPI0010FF378C|nr:DNA repair exonuclease [Peptoniphilus catoniae]
MKIVHMADTHLGRFYKGRLSPEVSSKRREEIWQTMEKNINYVKDNKIDVLLLCGDIYERDYFTASDMDRLAELLNSVKETEIFIISGNHDYLDSDSPIYTVEFNKNIHFFEKEEYFEIENLKLRVYGFSWNKKYDFKADFNFNLDKNFSNILMLHGSTINEEHFALNKEEIEGLGFDYVALGHIHIRQKISNRIYYSGSPEPVSFKDTGSHGFIEIDLDEKTKDLKIDYKGESLRNYYKHDLEINKTMSIYTIKDKIEDMLEGLEKDFNKITLIGSYGDSDYLIEYLNYSLNYFYLEIEDDLKPDYDLDDLYEKNKDNLLGKFIEKARGNEKVIDYGLRALMEAKNED